MADKKKTRIRRQPEEARRLILDAAEAGMTAEGPAGLRLQDVAAAAGVSHPTILHHFGSREGLVRALNLRALEELKSVVIGRLDQPDDGGIRGTFAAYRNGLAQRMLWLLQSAAGPAMNRPVIFEDIVKALHEVRLRFAKPGATVDMEDTRAIVHLTSVAAFGDAVIGPRLRQAGEGDEPAAAERFVTWYCNLLKVYLHASG